LLKTKRKQAESLKESSVGQRPANRNAVDTKPSDGKIRIILPLRGCNRRFGRFADNQKSFSFNIQTGFLKIVLIFFAH
jgi:hypothetical protein